MAVRQLSGNRILITGASSGIGRHLALELARQGAVLALTARRQELLDSLVQEIHLIKGKAFALTGDITLPEFQKKLIEKVVEQYGGLDTLVNNAGIGAIGRFEHAAPERLRKILEVNFFAPAELIRLTLPLLKQGTRPLIVNISSILGHRGIPRHAEYCASKFALQGFSESLRAELAAQGMDLLVVSPGTTETDFFDNLLEKQGELPWPQQPGQSPVEVARQIIRGMRQGKHEIIPNLRGRILCRIQRLSPWLMDKFLARWG